MPFFARLVSLTAFRVGTETISSDPSDREDGDTTTWAYHDASGLETSQTYADGKGVSKAYDAFNRLKTETDGRGVTKTHSYEHARGLLPGTAYSDRTTARSYAYNHLGQLTQVVDDAGTRTLGYNAYGELATDSLSVGNGVKGRRGFAAPGAEKIHSLGSIVMLENIRKKAGEADPLQRSHVIAARGVLAERPHLLDPCRRTKSVLWSLPSAYIL